MPRLTLALALMGLLLLQQTAAASGVTVTGDTPRENIAVTIEASTLNSVLQNLGQKYGFEVKGLDKMQNTDALSANMSGSLQSVLERLLRNWNHMIVRSPDNKSGIEKVMIFDSSYGALPSKAGRTTATQNGDGDPVVQLLSGQN